MVGTRAGAIKMMATMRKKYGGKEGVSEFFQSIGRIGGQRSNTGGFAADKERAKWAGAKGGKIGRRGHKFIRETKKYYIYIKKETGEEVRCKKEG